MSQQMALNYDAVSSAISQISVLVSDIETRNNKFVQILQESNEKTQNKYPVTMKLHEKITEEANNFKKIITAMTELQVAVQHYSGNADDAASTQGL